MNAMPLRATVAAIASASTRVVAIGFSQRIARPREAARSINARCWIVSEVIATASTASSSASRSDQKRVA